MGLRPLGLVLSAFLPLLVVACGLIAVPRATPTTSPTASPETSPVFPTTGSPAASPMPTPSPAAGLCPAPGSSEADGAHDEEYAVYAAVLRAMLLSAGTQQMVIRERTEAGIDLRDPTQLGFVQTQLPGIDQSLLDCYAARNGQSYRLADDFDLGVRIVLLSNDKFNSIFEGGGWDEFYRSYPTSPGIVTFSKVGFSSDRQRALVYMGNQSDYLAGIGQMILLGLQSDGWVVLNQLMIWIS